MEAKNTMSGRFSKRIGGTEGQVFSYKNWLRPPLIRRGQTFGIR